MQFESFNFMNEHTWYYLDELSWMAESNNDGNIPCLPNGEEQ